MVFAVSTFLPSRFFRIIPPVCFGLFSVHTSFAGWSDFLFSNKHGGDPGWEGTANEKLQTSEICALKKRRKRMQPQTAAVETALGADANTQTILECWERRGT